MKKKSTLEKKLKAYASLAGATLAIGEADAQVVYTDISPDFTGGSSSTYFLDLNDDNVDDFRIYAVGSYSSTNLYIAPLTSSNEVLGSASYPFAYPYALSFNAPIDSYASGSWVNYGYSSYGYQSLNYGSGSFGNFINVTDRYLGLHLEVNGNTYFGWARMDVNTNGDVWTIKDYAYESTALATIYAGYVQTEAVTNILPADIGNVGNGADLEVTFDQAVDEDYVAHYRLMAVKSAAAPTFDLAAADAVAPGNFKVLATSGSASYTSTMGAGAKDTDGDPIVDGVAYRIFVMSYKNNTNTTASNISQAPNDITLGQPADAGQNVVATDIDNNGNGSDLEVKFNAAADENTVSEYRIMVVLSSNAASFDVTTAAAIGSSDYTVISPSGSSEYVKILDAASTDVDGNAIVNGTAYKVFIFSLADGVLANLDGLSTESNEVTLDEFTGIANVSPDEAGFYYANGQLHFDKATRTINTVSIHNVKGQLEYSTNLSDKTVLDVSFLSKGVYFVHVDEDAGIQVLKFVKD